jgi:hypothetical protein
LRIFLTGLIVALLTASCGGGGDSTVTGNSTATTTSGTTATTTTTAASPVANPALGQAVLSWNPPLENTDGTLLTDLAGYKIYYGTDMAILNNVVNLPWGGNVVYTVQNLAAGTWYFTVRAYNSLGVESDYSETASKTIS